MLVPAAIIPAAGELHLPPCEEKEAGTILEVWVEPEQLLPARSDPGPFVSHLQSRKELSSSLSVPPMGVLLASQVSASC